MAILLKKMAPKPVPKGGPIPVGRFCTITPKSLWKNMHGSKVEVVYANHPFYQVKWSDGVQGRCSRHDLEPL